MLILWESFLAFLSGLTPFFTRPVPRTSPATNARTPPAANASQLARGQHPQLARVRIGTPRIPVSVDIYVDPGTASTIHVYVNSRNAFQWGPAIDALHDPPWILVVGPSDSVMSDFAAQGDSRPMPLPQATIK